ncbi:MAG: Zn-dependent alcohol dehydrogenase [Rhodobacteraceae bacterium]|nr:Zn-dependent alcohol dehydrogenase [Paracoccaceae bacterium]
MREIRAAICREFGAPLSVETVRLRPPGPGEVEVRLQACAICHSDIAYARGAWGGPLPAVYGHEAAGIVAAVGPGVQRVRPGESVVVTLIRSCGHCPSCAAGAPTICETQAVADSPLSLPDGTPVARGLETAAFAEAVVVDESQLVPVPPDLAPDVVALLACGVITGVGAAMNTARVRPGSSVVVIGAGGVGLNAVQGAVLCGAAHVIALDTEPEKLSDARAFGATAGVLATSERPDRDVKRLLGGRGADYVLVTVGAIAAYAGAMRFLAPGGAMVMVGMPASGQRAEYEPVIIAARNQKMLGSKMGEAVIARDIPLLVDLYRQGRLKLDELISNRYPLEQINEAIAGAASGRVRRNVLMLG